MIKESIANTCFNIRKDYAIISYCSLLKEKVISLTFGRDPEDLYRYIAFNDTVRGHMYIGDDQPAICNWKKEHNKFAINFLGLMVVIRRY